MSVVAPSEPAAGAPAPRPGARAFRAKLLAVTALALVLRAHGLADQVIFPDDHAVAISAVQYVERGVPGPTMWNHPHLRDVLVYVSTAQLGVAKLPLVLWSLVLGVAAVPLLGVVARQLLASDRAALLAAALLAIDALHIGFSRQAIQETYMAAFTLLGLAGALAWRSRASAAALAGAGVAFGLAIASKWYPVFPLAVTWVFLLRDARIAPDRAARVPRASFVTACLVLIPATVYLLTFAPWFAAGSGDLVEWLELQVAMARESAVHMGYKSFELTLPQRAWSWFVWPSWYVDAAPAAGGPVVRVAASNPVVWFLALPAVAWVALRWRGSRRAEDMLLVALFLAAWLPFVPVNRPIWLHSALGPLPFALMAIAAAVDGVAARRPRGGRLVAAYVALAVAAAAPLYLLAIGAARDVPVLRAALAPFTPMHEPE